MIVECYDMHLYCEYKDDTYQHIGGANSTGYGFAQIAEPTKRLSYKEARRQGWTITKDKRVLCPWCKKQGRKLVR